MTTPARPKGPRTAEQAKRLQQQGHRYGKWTRLRAPACGREARGREMTSVNPNPHRIPPKAETESQKRERWAHEWTLAWRQRRRVAREAWAARAEEQREQRAEDDREAQRAAFAPELPTLDPAWSNWRPEVDEQDEGTSAANNQPRREAGAWR